MVKDTGDLWARGSTLSVHMAVQDYHYQWEAPHPPVTAFQNVTSSTHAQRRWQAHQIGHKLSNCFTQAGRGPAAQPSPLHVEQLSALRASRNPSSHQQESHPNAMGRPQKRRQPPQVWHKQSLGDQIEDPASYGVRVSGAARPGLRRSRPPPAWHLTLHPPARPADQAAARQAATKGWGK